MDFFRSFDISASALTAERLHMDVIAANLANAQTTRTEAGTPYRRQMVVYRPASLDSTFAQVLAGFRGGSGAGTGVVVDEIIPDESPFRQVYEPSHPDANADGYVLYPNVDVVFEMVDMIAVVRAYEANTTAIQAAKSIAQSALQIGRF